MSVNANPNGEIPNDGYERKPVGGGRRIAWDEDKPVTLRGCYLGAVEEHGKFDRRRHEMRLLDGEYVCFPAPAILARLLAEVRPGELIEIEWKCETMPSDKGQPTKVFTVNKLRPRRSPQVAADVPPPPGDADAPPKDEPAEVPF